MIVTACWAKNFSVPSTNVPAVATTMPPVSPTIVPSAFAATICGCGSVATVPTVA